MRFALVGVWMLSVVSSVITGLAVEDPWVWGTFGAGLAGAVLVSRRPSRFLRRDAWLTVLSTVVASLVIFSYPAPSGELWMYFFAAYLASALMLRGSLRLGLCAGAIVCLVGASWVAVTDPRAQSFVAVLLLPLVSLGVFSLMHRSLLFYVRKELLQQASTEQSRAQEAAAIAAAERSHLDLAEVRRESAGLLQQVSAGDPVDAEMRTELVLVEATIREAIRSPLLQHPELNAAVLDVRRQGVTVVRLGEVPEGQPVTPLGDDLARTLAAHLTSLSQAESVTLRVIPGESERAVSLLVKRTDGVVRLEFARDGSICSQH
jgi:hypothetical protein